MEESTLLDLVKKRFTSAKKFTKKKYIDPVKRAMKDYDIDDAMAEDLSIKVDRHAFNPNKRYEMKIPMIFTNVESMKASLFERLPDLVIKGKGKDDEGKKVIVDATYEYLKDKLSLISIADQAAHWFILTGFCSAQCNFESWGQETMVTMEDGTEIPQMDYGYNDPIVEVCDPEKYYFSQNSKFRFPIFLLLFVKLLL